MASSLDDRIAYMGDAAALPRSNGELVFAAPWEGRAFGVAVALSDGGAYQWREFRERLVAEINADEQVAPAGNTGDAAVEGASEARERTYYERWLASLEALVMAKGLATQEELERHALAAAAEDDHDHDHDHDHRHDHHHGGQHEERH